MVKPGAIPEPKYLRLKLQRIIPVYLNQVGKGQQVIFPGFGMKEYFTAPVLAYIPKIPVSLRAMGCLRLKKVIVAFQISMLSGEQVENTATTGLRPAAPEDVI